MRRCLCLFGLALVAGCSGDWGTVSGTVMLDNAPLAEGNITFHPVGGGADAYGTIKDGAFTLSTGQKTGLKVGKCKVSISATTIPEMGTKAAATGGTNLAPKKYGNPETSGFTADVQAGSNSFKFEMVSK